ncbi:hypothetical protein WAI453_010143 [Rhynchosporium graminicola]
MSFHDYNWISLLSIAPPLHPLGVCIMDRKELKKEIDDHRKWARKYADIAPKAEFLHESSRYKAKPCSEKLKAESLARKRRRSRAQR